MANIKSQIKRIRTNLKAQERNKAVKSEVKSAVRATREAIASGDKEKATTALRAATRKLDKAASKGVIHKNQAANRSRRSRSRSPRSDARHPFDEGPARCAGPSSFPGRELVWRRERWTRRCVRRIPGGCGGTALAQLRRGVGRVRR